MKESIQEEITLINIYTPKRGAPKYVKQILNLKGEIDNKIITLGDFNTTHQWTDHPVKINNTTMV